jgi:hypothetical protein
MDSQQMTEAFDYPNTMSQEEREAYLLELYPMYIPPNRIPQLVELEPAPVIEIAPEISAPPVETDEPIAEEPKRHPALANVYSWVTNPLSGPK